MTDLDEWGKDPSVQIMRKVFKGMEKAQHDLLKRLDIIPYDLRMRRWRDQALALFETAWGFANRMGITMDEHTASAVYVHCLAKIMGAEQIHMPAGILPESKSVERILKEVFS
jgi:Mor family transcriptional regulator